jgi:hypothetical protein
MAGQFDQARPEILGGGAAQDVPHRLVVVVLDRVLVDPRTCSICSRPSSGGMWHPRSRSISQASTFSLAAAQRIASRNLAPRRV